MTARSPIQKCSASLRRQLALQPDTEVDEFLKNTISDLISCSDSLPITPIMPPASPIHRCLLSVRKQLDQLPEDEVDEFLEITAYDLTGLACSFKTIQNARNSVLSVLPIELLPSILRFAVPPEPNGPFDPLPIVADWRNRVELTRVCKTWRVLALQCPEFWAGALLHGSCKRLKRMMPRWGDLPRRVCVHERWKVIQRYPKLYTSHYLRELIITYPWNFPQFAALLPPNSTFPALRLLEIYFRASQVPTHRIPSHWISASPGLRHLILEYCVVDRETILLSTGSASCGLTNLLTLHLDHVSPPPPNRVINSIISSSPDLFSLRLDSTLENDFTPSRDWPTLSLQDCLIAGRSEASPDLMFKILEMTPLPETRLVLRLCNERDRGNDGPFRPYFLQLLSRCLDWLSRPVLFPGKQLKIREADKYLVMTLGDPLRAGWYNDIEDQEDFKLDFSLVDHPAQQSMLQHIHVPHVTSLCLEVWDEISEHLPVEQWREFLGRHRAVTTLELYQIPDIGSLINFLDIEANQDATLTLPRLRHLVLLNTNFGQDDDDNWDTEDEDWHEEDNGADAEEDAEVVPVVDEHDVGEPVVNEHDVGEDVDDDSEDHYQPRTPEEIATSWLVYLGFVLTERSKIGAPPLQIELLGRCGVTSAGVLELERYGPGPDMLKIGMGDSR